MERSETKLLNLSIMKVQAVNFKTGFKDGLLFLTFENSTKIHCKADKICESNWQASAKLRHNTA